MVNRWYVVLAALVLTGVAIILVSGHHPWDGPPALEFSETHGLHVGDLTVLAAWIVGTGFCWRVWRREGQ